MRLTQDIDSSNVDYSKITKLCIKKKEEKPTEIIKEVSDKNKVIFNDDDDDDFEFSYSNNEDEDEGGGGDFEQISNMDFGNLQFGGGKKDELMRDFTGLKPNFFSSRLEERDPILFLKEKRGKFSAYSRICQSTAKRQPVILTDEEKQYIDEKHPNSYSYAIKYGSKMKTNIQGEKIKDDSKEYWYICPRYWCLPENTSLTEEEVKAGVCGGVNAIIPPKAKTIPKGKTIFEFTSKKHINEFGDYEQYGPGFVKGKPHPDNLCVPCCFKAWDFLY